MLRTTFLTGTVLCLIVSAALGDTIGQAKALPVGSTVAIGGSITLVEPTDCYIEATDGSSGIWVLGDTQGLQVNDVVTVTGTTDVTDGECVIRDASIAKAGNAVAVRPFGIRGISIGGGPCGQQMAVKDYAISWITASGANNTGIIIKTWGTVTAVCYSPISDAHWFHIDDGSGVIGDNGDAGIVVFSDAAVSEGDFAVVTGVSSVETAMDEPARLVRVVRPRSSEDVVVARENVWKPPFPASDEFGGPGLDPNWVVYGYLSLSTRPGWSALLYQGGTWYSSLSQLAAGDWDMETKVCIQFSALPAPDYCVHFGLNASPTADKTGAFTSLALISGLVPGSTRACASLLGQAGIPLDGDTYWLRFRIRRPMVYASVSSDGVEYSDEVSAQVANQYLRIWCENRNPAYSSPFTALLDYVRFTPVAQ